MYLVVMIVHVQAPVLSTSKTQSTSAIFLCIDFRPLNLGIEDLKQSHTMMMTMMVLLTVAHFCMCPGNQLCEAFSGKV